MPLLRNSDKSKLSKRKNPTSIRYYERMGFLVIPDTFELPAIGPHRVMYITPDVDTFS